MVKRKTWRPLLDEKVTVPWGFDRVPGRVLRLYGPPGRPTALVAVALEGANGEVIGEHTVSFPLDQLEPVESAAAG